MDALARFPRVWCPTCNKTQPMIFDVMKANDKNEHDAADIVCNECKSASSIKRSAIWSIADASACTKARLAMPYSPSIGFASTSSRFPWRKNSMVCAFALALSGIDTTSFWPGNRLLSNRTGVPLSLARVATTR